MDVNTCFVYICNMSAEKHIHDSPEIRLLMFECVKLGRQHGWSWRQKNVNGPYWRAYWNRIPGGFVKVGTREVELAPDKIVVIAPETVYSTRLENEIEHFYVHFSAGRPFTEVTPQMFEIRSPGLLKMAESLAGEVRTAHHNYRTLMRVNIYAAEILLTLPEQTIPPLTEYDSRVVQAQLLLESLRNISNSELARRVNMSTNGFLQLFRQETGISPQAYSRKKRLENACIMLDFSESSIDEIALETSFCDRYHFSRAFKNEYGISPAKYRKMLS